MIKPFFCANFGIYSFRVCSSIVKQLLSPMIPERRVRGVEVSRLSTRIILRAWEAVTRTARIAKSTDEIPPLHTRTIPTGVDVT
jgi:hypothetical protein